MSRKHGVNGSDDGAVVARTHERIRWRRSDFTHQASRRLVNHYDLLAVEALSVQNMMANHALAKSIHDAAWTQFASLLACKAAWADRRLVAVNPAYTSQNCSGCGWRHHGLTLADRMFHCQNPARPDLWWFGSRPRSQRVAEYSGAWQGAAQSGEPNATNGIGMTMPAFGQEAPAFAPGESSREMDSKRRHVRLLDNMAPDDVGKLSFCGGGLRI